MNKILLSIGSAIVLGGVIFGTLWWTGIWPQRQRSQPITIAVVGPQRGSNALSGSAMRRGVELYLNTHDVRKMLRGRALELRFFNDQNSTQQAARLADDVAGADALLVLGHYFSDSSLAAGDIYKKRGIPAITASATANAITANSEWYFRTIPNNLFQGQFIASYVHDILEYTTTAIIFDADLYGASLARSYEDLARELGMKIQGKWSVDRGVENVGQQIKNIITAIQNLDDPGVIFLATHEAEAVRIITTLKLPGTSYTIIGADALATPQFLAELRQNPQERMQSGYYSDGVYAVAPFIPELADEQALAFMRHFQEQYNSTPVWEAACYYDAIAMAIEAIKRAELDGVDLAADRRKVRDALAELSNPYLALTGVTGTLYFDQARNINRPLDVGMYEHQQLLPAYVQYQVFATKSPDIPVSQELFKIQNVLELGDLIMAPTHIIKTGININEISYLNLLAGQYTLDGYLWFRFQGDLEANEVKFLNAVAPVKLDSPVFEETSGNITMQIYHLKTSFVPQELITLYPWDRLILPVQFRHAAYPLMNLRYVADTANFTHNPEQDARIVNPITGWALENLMQVATTARENKALYSQFNLILQLRRMNIGWIVKNVFPLGALLLVVYWVYYLPIERPGLRLLLLGCGLAATILYQFLLRWQFRSTGLLVAEYGIFVLYGLIGLAVIVSLGGYVCYTRNAHGMATLLSFTGRILHPILAALMIVAGVIFTMMLPRILADLLARML